MNALLDLPVPSLVLKDSALSSNIRRMAEWCGTNGFDIAPHGKTTMCPQIFERQLAAGAWGITLATVSQAEVALKAGIKRILIANQVVGGANIRTLAAALDRDEALDILCLVDSIEGVEHLAAVLSKSNTRRRLGVLVEIGRTGWRTGTRSAEAAQHVFDTVRKRSAYLEFRGIEAFEGLAKNAAEAEDFLAATAATAERIAQQCSDSQLIFSAGGSSYLGPVRRALRSLSVRWKRVLRSGCYVTHDHGIYAQHQKTGLAADPSLPQFIPALELWACVQSLPDPGVAILTFGKRDCAYDISLPTPLDVEGATITALNDQHAYMSYPQGLKLSVGSMLRFGISHPCTAFDKWSTIPLVDDDYNIIDVYRTCF